jgi:hypothetical protein
VRQIRQSLARVRDGDRQVVSGILDAQTDGATMGVGGDSGGDIYLDLLPGYDFDPRLRAARLVSRRDPHGMHGFSPSRPSMQTIMVFNGPGVAPGRKLGGASIVDFAPTLSKLLDIPAPRDATGKILEEVLSNAR